MARWPSMTLSFLTLLMLVTSVNVPALLPAVGVDAGPRLDLGLVDVAPLGEPAPPGFKPPVENEAPPAAVAFGVVVSGATPTSAPLVGPEPIARAHSDRNRTEAQAVAGKVVLRGSEGSSVVDARGLAMYTAARSERWAMQAHARAQVAYVSLLGGTIEARGLNAQVFGSNGARADSNESRLVEVKVFGARVGLDTVGTAGLAIPLVGTLYLNQTVIAPCAGLSPCPFADSTTMAAKYALHLDMANGMDIYVAGAQVMTARPAPTHGTFCWTWSEAYPVGVKEAVTASQVASQKKNEVMADVMSEGRDFARVNDVPLEGSPFTYLVEAAVAEQRSTISFDANTSLQLASTRAEAGALSVNLLNGQVKADVLRAKTSASIALSLGASAATEASATAHTLGSVMVGLKVGGTDVNWTAAPNQQFELQSGGKVVALVILNEQTRNVTADAESVVTILRINLVRVVVTGHEFGVPPGTQIVLGHAIIMAACGLHTMPPMTMIDFGDPLGLRPGM